jgi:hypothetical protein
MEAHAQSDAAKSTAARSSAKSSRSTGVRRALLVVLVLNAVSAALKM